MTWNSNFASEVERHGPKAWRYLLTRLPLPYTQNPGSYFSVGSSPANPQSWMVDAPIIAGAGVTVSSWLPQVASCTVGVAIHSPADFAAFAQALPRGTAVSITATSLFNGYQGTIWLGVIESIDRVGAQCRVEMRSLFAALRTRINNTQGSLFYELDRVITARVGSGGYTAGDSTITLTVSVPSAFRIDPASGKGAAQVVPSTGEPFIVTFTGTSGNDLTGVSSAGIMGTTPVNAVLNDAVYPCAYLEGHPYDIARRVLASSSAGTNGSFDDYHESWGYGIDDALMDHADITLAREAIEPYPSPSSPGGFTIVHAVTERQPAAFDWLAGFLSTFGAWPVIRQGKITFRAAIDPKALTYGRLSTPRPFLTRNDIISVSQGEVFGPTVAVRKYNRRIVYDGGNFAQGFSSPATVFLPAESGIEDVVDLSQYLDVQADAENVAGRALRWDGFPPRVYTVTCRLRAALLAEGDWCYLGLDFIGTEIDPDFAAAAPIDRSVMVLAMTVDWARAQVALTLAMTSAP